MLAGPTKPVFTERHYEDRICGRKPLEPFWYREKVSATELEKIKAAYQTWDSCAWRARGHWRRAAAIAVSQGLVSCWQLERHGGGKPQIDKSDSACDIWKRLPKTLYHVTTNRDAVLKKGLRTRAQLRVEAGVGLGGGGGQAISTSDSRGFAGHIKRQVLESVAVAQERLPIGEMIRQAKKGEGAKHPWLEKVYYQFRGSRERRRDVPESISRFLSRGEVDFAPRDTDENYDNRPEETKPYYAPSEMPGCSPRRGAFDGSKIYKGRTYYWRFWCKATPAQRAEFALKFYYWWADARGKAGGPPDMITTAVDAAGVRALNPKQVSILKFESCPNTYGGHTGDKHEWKVVTPRNLKLVKVDGKKPPPGTKPSLLRCPKVKKVEIPEWWKEER